MAEYSAIRFTIDPGDRDVAELKDELLGACADWVEWHRPDVYADPNDLCIEVDEARFGDSILFAEHDGDPLPTPAHFAIAEGLGFTCVDWGGHEWGPWETAWQPGMSMLRSRHISKDGEPMLLASEFNALAELIDRHDLVVALTDHFGPDPRHWLGHTQPVSELTTKEDADAVRS